MIYYEKYGDANRPVIVCLHGANYVHCFSKQYDALSKNYCIVVPHLPGYGRNCDVTFRADLAVQQVAELIESKGRQVVLMGFSLGAQLCMPLVCKYGKLFKGAVFISPWLIKDPAEIEKAMKQQADNEKLAKSKIFIGINSLAMGLDKDSRTENEEYCKNVSMNTILASIDNGLLLSDFPEYAEVDMPMLALCGIKETLDIRKTTRQLAKDNPRCEYDMWDGAAHNIPFKYAARLNKTIEEFMNKIG